MPVSATVPVASIAQVSGIVPVSVKVPVYSIVLGAAIVPVGTYRHNRGTK